MREGGRETYQRIPTATIYLKIGQVDLAEWDENENEKGNGRQEVSKCGIGRRPCKPTLLCKIVWCI